MRRWTLLISMFALAALIVMGCSGGGGTPMTPDIESGLTAENESHGAQTQTHLWGIYDVVINIETQTAEVSLNRSAMFAANVVTFLNGQPGGGITITDLITPLGDGYVDTLLNVGLTHPLTFEQYKGYDVRGIFLGNGSGTMLYDGDIDYAVSGVDQYVMNEDGYSRWWNADEFGLAGVLGYTVGKIATPGYTPNATIGPYKYYADELDAEADVWEFLTDPGYEGNGVFSEGAINTRYWEIRFPVPDPNVKFGYAVVANWKGEDLDLDHPANAPEAIACSVDVTDNIYWVDDLDWGGNLIVDAHIAGWDAPPSTVYIESSVLTANASSTMSTVGGDLYSTYSFDIPADTVTSTGGAEFWVIAEYEGSSYVGEFTPDTPGAAPDAFLAAFFRYDLYISPEPYCVTELVSALPATGQVDTTATITIEAVEVCADPAPTARLLSGAEEIIGANITYIDETHFSADFDLTGATVDGVFDLYASTGCCAQEGMLPGVFTVIDAQDIHPTDTGIPGGGAIAITGSGVGGTLGNEDTADTVIDIAVQPGDGTVYVVWGHDASVAIYPNDGYAESYSADLTTSLNARTLYVYYPGTPPGWGDHRYGECFLEVHTGGVGLMCGPAWHWYGQLDLGATYWGGSGYVAYAPNYPADIVSSGEGNVTSYHAFTGFGPIYRSWMSRPPFTSAAPQLVTGSSDYDGAMSDHVIGMAAGSSWDQLWGLADNTPHVYNYNNHTWAAMGGTEFGDAGTADGQFTNPLDITMTDTDIIYVLDEPTTGMTRIQAFDTSGTFLATSGEVATAAAPYRLDYNEYEDLIYVLYDNNTIEAWIDDIN